MRKRDRKALARYVRNIADQMGLRDWDIRLSDESADDGKAASVRCAFGRKHARILIGKGFRDESPEDQRDTIIHELIHPLSPSPSARAPASSRWRWVQCESATSPVAPS